jgi:hypothetical protein
MTEPAKLLISQCADDQLVTALQRERGTALEQAGLSRRRNMLASL